MKRDIDDINSDSSNYNANYPFEARDLDNAKQTKMYSDSLRKIFSRLSKKKREQILRARQDKLERRMNFYQMKTESSSVRDQLIRKR
jgi:hypothetical protein